MLSAALRAANHHRSVKPLHHLPFPPNQAPSFPTQTFRKPNPNVSSSPSSDPIDQFLPPRTLPSPPLPQALLHDIILSLNRSIKTNPQCYFDLQTLSKAFLPAPLSRLLRSFPHPSPALAFFDRSLPDLSPSTVRSCCLTAHLLVYAADDLKPLAQDLLTSVLLRTEPGFAVELFNWTARHRAYKSYYTVLHLVLRAFLGAGMAIEAMEAVHLMRNQGMTPSLSALAILLRLLFRMGDLGNAWKLFRDVVSIGPRPSVRTFNAMILGFCQKGFVRIGEGLLGLMSKFCLEPEACSFNIVIKAHCVLGRSSDAFELFGSMLESGCAPSAVTYNILIDALCREGRMKEAKELFDDMEEKGLEYNTVTYNALIDGYVKSGQIDKANEVYGEMRAKGLAPDCYTFNILVAGYSKFRRNWGSEGEWLLNDVLRPEGFPDNSMLDVLVSRFCWDNRLDDAQELLHRAIEDGVPASVAGFNSVITGYSKKGLEEEAFDLYRVMVEVGLSPSTSTCNSLLLGLCKRGRLDEARELMDRMAERGFCMNLSALTIFIDGCFRAGDVSEALRCWNEMERQGIYPDVIAFSAYINGLCRANYMDEALEAFHEMGRRGLIPNNFVYNSLILGFCRTDNVAEALKLEREMRQNGLVPDIFTSNIIINGFCREGRLKMANNMLMEMYNNGLTPDIVTYNTFISAYCRAFDMVSAVSLVYKMSSEGCEPDIFTYNIWIHSLCSSHMMNRAMKILDQLVSMGVVPNSVTCNTVMNGICVDVLDRAMILTGKLLKMAFVPNVVTINLILSHFCKQGMAKRALMWGEKLSEVSFSFDDATRNILERAYRDMQEEADVSMVESGRSLFLDFLMHVTYECILRNELPKYRQLTVSSIIDHGFTVSSKMMDVR